MELLEGLKIFEIILMFLGILLFLVLLFILVYSVLRERPLKYVLPSFLIPIVMIAFPAIRKIQFGNNVIEMQEKIAAVEENPDDSEALAELEERLEMLEESENLQPSTLVTLARGHAAKGDTAAALTYVDSAMKQAPKLEIQQQSWVDIVRAQQARRIHP
ncbi:MAG: hypothetical protein V3W14_00620 [Candidatus Neomarinimicrobiota bacterium]